MMNKHEVAKGMGFPPRLDVAPNSGTTSPPLPMSCDDANPPNSSPHSDPSPHHPYPLQRTPRFGDADVEHGPSRLAGHPTPRSTTHSRSQTLPHSASPQDVPPVPVDPPLWCEPAPSSHRPQAGLSLRPGPSVAPNATPADSSPTHRHVGMAPHACGLHPPFFRGGRRF